MLKAWFESPHFPTTSLLVAALLSGTALAQEAPAIPRPDPAVAEFARGVKFTVAGYNGGAEALTNFPVLVRISESGISGFRYADFNNADGSDIGFVDAEGNGLAYDIDTWDTNGESLVWVNLPVMTNNAEFAMWYHSSKTGKALNPDNVWTNYAGVWHFAEDYGTETGSVNVYDSTTNGLTGATLYNNTTKGTSVSAGKVGRARRMGDNIADANKGTGGIDVELGGADSPKRAAVDRLASPTPVFSTSFWIYPEMNVRYPYYVSRKNADTYPAWAIQSNDNKAGSANAFRVFSRGTSSGANMGVSNVGAAQNKWTKIDVVYTAEGTSGKGYFYVNGVLKNNGNLNSGKAANGSVDLYIGGGSGGDCRPFGGVMDEVRLQYGRPTAARIKADFDTVSDASFLTAGTVVEVAIVERPVVHFTVEDTGASHIQFGGTLSSLGSDEAAECAFYGKVWPSSGSEPATWTEFSSGLTGGALSGLVKGLTPATAYSYKLKVTNDEEVDSDEEEGSFTTSGVGVGGTGGFVTRIGDDWIHYFRVETDDDSGETTTAYTFTPPSYADTVRALVVAGGGPGGYRAGGGGGAGGLYYNAALGVTGGADYAINVGTGGVASAGIDAYGVNGGNSSIVGGSGIGSVNIEMVGGGAGGNGTSTSVVGVRAGLAGGSGGGSSHTGNAGGSATQGQGSAGGKGNSDWLAGGGGGALAEGGSALDSGDYRNAGNGGGGFESDISGVSTYYAGGGGGGGLQVATKPGSPGHGGNGGGGTGSRRDVQGNSSAPTSGADGLGGGGGGGSGDVEAYYRGGDGGDGIVIVRYHAQGDGTAIPQPIVSLQSATCNDAAFKGEVTFRVAWAGYGHNDADVAIAWGYAEDSLVHTNGVANGVIGVGSGSFDLIADECTVYLRAVATNASGVVGVSTETLSFYVADNPLGQDDNTVPSVANVGIGRVDGAYAVITGAVTSLGMSAETLTVQALVGTSADHLNALATGTSGLGAASLAVDGLSPNTTYYYCLKVVDVNGGAASSAVESFTTLGPSVGGDITPAVNQQTFHVSAPLTALGAGTTYVLVRWSEDNGTTWTDFSTVATRTALDPLGTVTTPDYRRSSWGNVRYEFVVSNECVTSAGVPNGVAWSSTQAGEIAPIDKAIYTWKPADGDWNGNWSDSAHWTSTLADCRGYPNDVNASVRFYDCPDGQPVVVTIDGKYTVNFFGPNATNDVASDITFRGNGRAASSLTATEPCEFNKPEHVCSNSRIQFEDMTLAFGKDWQIMRTAANDGTGDVKTNILVRFSNVALTTTKQIKLCAPHSRLEFANGTTATATEVSVAGVDSVLLVDDSTVTVTTYLRLSLQCTPNDGVAIVFRGASPKLTAQTWFSPYVLVGQPAGVVFEVPAGGYASAPFVFSHNSNTFGQPDANGKVATHTFAVSPDSPALKADAEIVNNVLVQTTAGFYSTVLSDSVFVVPEINGATAGSFKWGVGGQPLAEGAELLTARQILLDLQGRSAEPVALTIPMPLPENVTLVSVTTNGVAVAPVEGIYTVMDGAEVAVTFAPADGYALCGDATAVVVMDGDTTLPASSIPTAVSLAPVTLIFPELPANVTVASVTTNGVAVAPVEGAYPVMNGASVVVTFASVDGYVLSGAPTSATIAINGDTTFPAASVPTAISPAQAIRINEVMASNPSPDKGGITTKKGIPEMDWVEFYNASSEDIDITGWYLSDNLKKGKETKAQILGSCIVPAGGYEIVWLDKTHIDPSEYAADEAWAVLKLSSDGDPIQLADPDVTVVDAIDCKTVPKPQIKGVSYGPGILSYGPYAGTATNVYMKVATPRAENVTEGWGDFTPAVAFSEPHGYKTAPFQLTLTCENIPDFEGAGIWYTLDGTPPATNSASSHRYTEPITISGTTVVRAAVPIEGTILQFDTSATYIFLDDVLAQGRSTTAPASAAGFPDNNAVNSQKMLYGLDQNIVNGADRDRLLRGFTNSISTISLVIDPANLFDGSTGIYVNPRGEGEAWERQTMLEIFDPKGAAADVSMAAGLRIRGGNSRNTAKAKHSLRFFFRSSYGTSGLVVENTKDGLFAGEPEAEEYDKLDLRTSQNLSWASENSTKDTFVTEVFSRDSQRDMGQPYTRSRYYNLFINGQYWGLYQTQERADEHFGESYLGGDSLKFDLIKTASSFVNNKLTYSIECNEGTWDAWTNLFHIAVDEGFADKYTNNYNRVLGLNPDGTRNPADPVLLNAESLMAYMFSTHFVVDQDGPTSPFSSLDKGHANNFNALRNRDDDGVIQGFVFLRHDAEISMGQNSNTTAGKNPTYWGTEAQTDPLVGSPDPTGLGAQKFRTVPYFTPAELHYLLMKNPDYRRQYADAFYKFFLREGGAMTVEKSAERYMNRMAEIDDAIVCEAARWAQSGQTRSTWLKACGTSLDFITNRVASMKSQYIAAEWYPSIDAPTATNAQGRVFADGDKIDPDEKVYFSGADAGTVYYTTNGLDPRAVDGSVAEGAIAYDPASGAALPEIGALVKARVLADGGEWSALEEVEIDVNLPSDQQLGIRLAAIMSVPKNDPDGEFIVLTNILDRAVSLQGMTVLSEKSTKAPVALFTIADDIELAAGASLKLKKPDFWPGVDLKMKNNDIIVVLRDLNNKLVQTAIVKADTWFGGVCKGTGRWFVALEFGDSVTAESQWTPSPEPPKPTIIMAY